MNQFILGRKLKMTQIWKDGKVIPVTVIKADPNSISTIRTKDNNGYEAIQLSMPFGKKRILREFRTKGDIELKTGDSIDVSLFNEGDKVKVSSKSKGRGFQGTVKRYNFSGGPKTHGQKNRLRAPGSIGATFPQRVIKGKRMAGHMGVERFSVKNIRVVGIDKEKNELFLRGAVPGYNGTVVKVVKN